ncbi:MAG: hypothetical protein WD794_10990 [Mycobacteriales bacterium]
MSDELRQQFQELSPPTELHLPPPSALAALGRRRQRRRRAVAAAAAALVAVVPFAVLAGERLKPAPATVAAPQLEGMTALACGTSPLSVLTAESGAENEGSPEAAGLRHVLEEGIAGMSFPAKTGWVQMRRDDGEETVTFGRRVGEVGIDDVVMVKRQDIGSYTFAGSGGCGPLGFPDGRRATRISTYDVSSDGITLTWMGGTCGDGSEPVSVVHEAGNVVSVMVVPPPDRAGSCPDVGTFEQTEARLSAPLGNRRVVDAGYLPVIDVPSSQQYADQAADTSARDEAARTLCTSSARELGGKEDVSYAVTVDVVRQQVPEARSAWSQLSAQAPAAHCYLRRPDGVIWA